MSFEEFKKFYKKNNWIIYLKKILMSKKKINKIKIKL
jgi:hypothetical protein